MSGHSKWSTIKRQKEATDKKRGQLFSKLSRAITIAVKEGGSDPAVNLRLRLAIDKAKEANMPKDNIQRAIERATGTGSNRFDEIVYEGYGPFGVAIIVEAATDNRNRTAQEIKSLFERGGGSLGGPGSVSFQFEKKGLILVEKREDAEKTMLSLIDLGAPDLEESEDGIEVYVNPQEVSSWQEKLEKEGFKISSAELVNKPRVYVDVHDSEKARKVLGFLEDLDEHEDVQKVYANLDVPTDVLKQLGQD